MCGELPRLVVFAKAPELGRVKTGLARGIGDAPALAFYRATLERVAAALATDRRWATRLAVTPETALDREDLWPAGVVRVAQGEGDLGTRMMRFLATATPDSPLAVIGSDIPDLEPDHIGRAFETLRQADFALGPATDGGYWLIGARRPPPAALFQGVRWWSAHTLSDTLANVGGVKIGLLDTLEDVDEPEDYRRYLARRAAQP